MNILRKVGKVMAFVGTTLVFILLALLLVIFILEKGPSETATAEFVQSVNETSRMGFVSRIFLSDEEVEDIMNAGTLKELDDGETSDTDLIKTDEETYTDEIEILDIKGGSYRGKLMIIHDPSRVFLGTIPEFGNFDGMTVQTMINYYNDNYGSNVIGGINGGDFVDAGQGASATGQPLGVVIAQGEVLYQDSSDDEIYHLSGFTKDNKLVVGNMSINQALELGIRDALYTAHTTGPFLIVNGESMINEVPGGAEYGGGKNPRTAIGQREDGCVLLLVIDGRQANSIGATFKDLVQIMQQYGAVNAVAMDGGTSSQMIWQDEIISNPYSAYGPRKCPTAWFIQ